MNVPVIQKNIPFPEGSKNELSTYKRYCIELLKKMEVGDSIFIERTTQAAVCYIGQLTRQEKRKEEYDLYDYHQRNGLYGGKFIARKENEGTRIWRKL